MDAEGEGMTTDRKAYMKAYCQRPEVKERIKIRRRVRYQRPEVKERRKVYTERPDVKEHAKTYYKAYYQRPDVKKRIKARKQRLEVKERQKAYMKAYNRRPEVRERRNARMRDYQKKRRVLLESDAEAIIKDARNQYERLHEKDPAQATELLNELEASEGKDFAELLLDGIVAKVRDKMAKDFQGD